MWTDWVGSIPVYYAQLDHGWIASTLEPVVVAAAEFSGEDISIPALLCELVDGQFLDSSTLFTGMKIVPADSHATWCDGRFSFRRVAEVLPSCARWETDWDDLVDEMHTLVCQAIRDTLGPGTSWVVPLSSGLDSRLIAAVAVESGDQLADLHLGESPRNRCRVRPQRRAEARLALAARRSRDPVTCPPSSDRGPTCSAVPCICTACISWSSSGG